MADVAPTHTYADVLRGAGYSNQDATKYVDTLGLSGQRAPAGFSAPPSMTGAYSLTPGRAWVVGEDGKPVPLFDAPEPADEATR